MGPVGSKHEAAVAAVFVWMVVIAVTSVPGGMVVAITQIYPGAISPLAPAVAVTMFAPAVVLLVIAVIMHPVSPLCLSPG